MIDKSNTNILQMQHRKVEILKKSEIKNWSDLFSVFGYKKHCSRTTGVATETIKRIIKDGRGLEDTIASIRKYYETQSLTLK